MREFATECVPAPIGRGSDGFVRCGKCEGIDRPGIMHASGCTRSRILKRDPLAACKHAVTEMRDPYVSYAVRVICFAGALTVCALFAMISLESSVLVEHGLRERLSLAMIGGGCALGCWLVYRYLYPQLPETSA